MKHALLVLVALLLWGCKPAIYGGYNIGVCNVNNPDGFLESHVEVTADTFSIVANAYGVGMVDKLDQPLVFKFVGEEAGARKYEAPINGHVDDVIVAIDGTMLNGQFIMAGKPEAKLHGHLGLLKDLETDGTSEYENFCKKADAQSSIQ